MSRDQLQNNELLPLTLKPIYNSESLSFWEDSKGFIYAQWKGYISPLKMKDNSIFLLNSMHDRQCSKIILDTREVKGTWIQTIPWFANFFFPMVARKGVTKAAFIYSPNTFGQRAMERTLEVNTYFEAQAFQDLSTAENWLLNKPIGKIPFKENDTDEKIVIRNKEHYCILRPENIYYAYSHDKGTAFNCQNEIHFSGKPLKESLLELPTYFLQVHRSYIINTRYVTSIKHHDSGSYHVFLKDLPKIKIPVSKKFVPQLKATLNL